MSFSFSCTNCPTREACENGELPCTAYELDDEDDN